MRNPFRRYTAPAMDPCFEPLAVYNAERARGIVHEPEYAARMAELQRTFDRWVMPGRQSPRPTLPATFRARG